MNFLRVFTFILALLLSRAAPGLAADSGSGRLAPLGQQSQGQGAAVEVKHGKGPPRSVEDELQRHNIQLTRPALVNALRSPDPEVRWLAAAKLAQDKATETIPSVLEALASENEEPARVNIALSLAQFGEARGFSALQEACGDRRLRPYLRLQAARYMLDFLQREDESCRKSVVEILQSQPNSDALLEAVSILRRAHSLSRQESEAIFEAAVKALVAPDISLRLVGSRTLGETGSSSAIAYLQRALAKEQDETVRSQIGADLQKLQKKR
jgi:HEAT repeat protein